MSCCSLHKAAESGDLQACISLLQQNSTDKNAKDPYGRTALHCAAARGHSHIVKQLIASGLDPSITDAAGMTAKDLATEAAKGFMDSINALEATNPLHSKKDLPGLLNTDPDKLTCPKGHSLLSIKRLQKFYCDGCNAKSDEGDTSFRCKACDYELCVECMARRCSLQCPQKHRLIRFLTPADGYKCDLCSAVLSKASITAGCKACDYDVCVKCISNKVKPPVPTLPQPSIIEDVSLPMRLSRGAFHSSGDVCK